MNLGLDGKGFIVGGGSRGLGRAIAEQLIAEGARVLLVARDRQRLDQTTAELGGRAFAHAADLADPGTPPALSERIGGTIGRLDGVLINAGGPPAGSALTLSDEQWRESFELLIGGPLRMVRELSSRMSAGGAVLFIASSSSRQLIAGLDSSNVLRPGVAALSKCLARELAPAIRVNAIAPGRLDTERVEQLDEAGAGRAGVTLAEQRRQSEAAIPLGRYGEPAELARLAAFLLSDAASYLTGATYQVDGGLVSATP